MSRVNSLSPFLKYLQQVGVFGPEQIKDFVIMLKKVLTSDIKRKVRRDIMQTTTMCLSDFFAMQTPEACYDTANRLVDTWTEQRYEKLNKCLISAKQRQKMELLRSFNKWKYKIHIRDAKQRMDEQTELVERLVVDNFKLKSQPNMSFLESRQELNMNHTYDFN